MKSMHKLSFLLTAGVLLALAGTASATNGYFTHGTGTKNKGMAGAGMAGATDSISIANNPASAIFAIGKLDAGAAIFSPLRSYNTSTSLYNGAGTAFTIGPNDLDSDRNYFVIPHVAYTWGVGTNGALGVAFYGRGGMNTKWQGGTASFFFPPAGQTVTPPGTFGAGKAGVDLSQAFLDIAYASKTSDKFAWGAALVVAVQSFEAYGVNSFAPFTQTFAESGGAVFPANLSDNGHELSTGVGAKVGIDFAHIPADAKFGLTFKANEGLSLSFDVEHIWYSDIGSVGNPFANIFTCPSVNPLSTDFSGCLGGSNGAGFGWDDMTVYKVGVEWSSGSSDYTWRAGYSHGSQPIASTEVMFNILAPGTIEDHISGGFTKKMGETGELNFSATYAFDNSVTGPNLFDFDQFNPLGPPQNIEISMYQWEVELSYTWRFGK